MSADIIISMVDDACSTATRQVRGQAIINGVKQGKWQQVVERIRHVYQEILTKTGSRKAAKQALDRKKKALPGVMWSGTFRNRSQPTSDKFITHSGLLCADL